MNFLSPFALLMATLSVPLLLLYFLKVRRRQMRVSSLLLWAPALRDREASTFFQRLQRDPLLLLQILALLALTAALARPAVNVMGQGAKRVAIVMDGSASMKATDVSPSRFVQAQRAALGLLGRLGEGAEVMVIEAGVQPRVLVPFTREHDRVSSGIRSMEAHDLPNRLQEGLRTARVLVGMGFTLVATQGTAKALGAAGLVVARVNKVAEGRPHVVDMIKNGEIVFIINTVEEKRTAIRDSYQIRRAALQRRVTLYTTLAGARAAANGMAQAGELQVYSVQNLHKRLAV